jgi:uncharacterized SAM-binding protein YcdF (DUF218 family)
LEVPYWVCASSSFVRVRKVEMTSKDDAITLIWNYMHLHHKLSQADAIFVLGSFDTRVADYAAQLFLQGLAPILVCAGSGTVHAGVGACADVLMDGSTEAEVFADIARKAGVPDDAILIENQSQNTGQNYEFTSKLLEEKGVQLKKVIAVQKPFMERRTYATGKIWWADVEILVTSPRYERWQEYPIGNEVVNIEEHWLHCMVGDLQRIKEYPKRGFQIEQEMPDDVWEAYNTLVDLGYTKMLIK